MTNKNRKSRTSQGEMPIDEIQFQRKTITAMNAANANRNATTFAPSVMYHLAVLNMFSMILTHF